MQIHFITFGDGNTERRAAAQRLSTQAAETGWFTSSSALHYEDLPKLSPQWFDANRTFLESNPRGLGYWIWKPLIILEHLKKLRPGDFLVYADAGHEISIDGKERFEQYLKIAAEHGMLCFEIGEKIRKWTKGDLLEYFGIAERTDILEANQVQAGLLLIRRTTTTVLFASHWAECCTARGHILINDDSSIKINPSGFLEHRHDQSIFSVLFRLTKVGFSLPDESYHPELLQKGSFIPSIPFHCFRNPTGIRMIPKPASV
jgi:hypothetical protein